MRIYSKKAFLFVRPDAIKDTSKLSKETKCEIRPMEFKTVPNWVKDDVMFQWGVASGSIEIIDSKKDEVKAETGEPVDLSKYGAKKLYEMCIEKGIKCEERQSKEYYIGLLNGTIEITE